MPLILNKRLQTGYQISPPVLSFTATGASQPQDIIIDYSGSATLTAVAVAVNPSTSTNASGTITYQWYKNDVLMSGETSSNLYLSSQVTAASYYCISNFIPGAGVAPAINGPIKSRVATTTIKIYISITSQPSYKRITEGQTAIFDISAIASNGNNGTLRYDWFLNGALILNTVGGTYSSVSVSPAPGSYSIFCKVSQGGVPGATQAPSVNSSVVTLDVDAKPLAQCLNWDDPIRPGGKFENIVTASGSKPSNEETWYGVWEWGTNTDTCYISFNVDIKDIHPRAGFTDANLPFAVEFECNISGANKGDVYRIYKVVDWGGSSPNQNAGDRKNLDFNDNNVDGQTNIYYGDNGRVLFNRTNTSKTAYGPDAGGGRLYWDPSWGKARMYIRVGRAFRKSDGNQINWFAQVDTTKNNNRVEFGRRYDPNINLPENRSVSVILPASEAPVTAAARPVAKIQYTHQKSATANYDQSEVGNYNLSSWSGDVSGQGVGKGSPPIGNNALSFGVGQWQITPPDRDIEVAIEMAGAGGQGATSLTGNSVSGGSGGVGVIYLRLLKGKTYTFNVGRIGSAKGSNYPDEISPGGGFSGSELDSNSGNGGGATFLYAGGRLIAVAGGGGGAGRGGGAIGQPLPSTIPGNIGGKGGGPGQSGTDGSGDNGATGATTSGPGNNKNTSLYNRDSRSNNRDNWMRDNECNTWIPGTNPGACDCTYENTLQQVYDDNTNPKRKFADTNAAKLSCDTYGKSEIK